MIRRDHLLRRGVQIKNALVEEIDVLDEGNLPVQTRIRNDALRLTDLQNQRLLGLMYREKREIGADQGRNQDEKNGSENTLLHRRSPSVLRFMSSFNGK